MPAKYTQEQAEREFAHHGFILKETYINDHTPCLVICSCGEWTDITLNSVQQGRHCKRCGKRKRVAKKRLSQEYVEQYFMDHGCKLLSCYTHKKIDVKYQCFCGRISYITFGSFCRGSRCKICGVAKQIKANSGDKHYKWNPDREQVQQHKEIREQQSQILWGCLQRLETSKEGHTHEILGYSALELDMHLRSFSMYAYLQDTHTLAIDHILPVKAFIDHGIIDPKIICALDNLQPLSRSENCEKKDWYIEDEFLAYCQKHNIALLAEAI